MNDLYRPPDVDEANDAWGATCGPAALAAIARMPVNDVRHFFPGFPGFTNLTTMTVALQLSGLRHRKTPSRHWPPSGLAFVQWV